jgi:hypothetical protein
MSGPSIPKHADAGDTDLGVADPSGRDRSLRKGVGGDHGAGGGLPALAGELRQRRRQGGNELAMIMRR